MIQSSNEYSVSIDISNLAKNTDTMSRVLLVVCISNLLTSKIEISRLGDGKSQDTAYSVHSFRAAKSLNSVWFVISKTFLLLPS